ncbi:hypothetical protein H6P81_007041 [Aristolochia fimbriata]|uniref:Photolyase/cryptochrome alpha/beta domain-containing protein n=1 Tax=Aristolochia fimbriata TaxID=158543 RepID=A0AAV7F2G1_ARIFI|nr:hypothetical protein H6P81_007041 [Aristolochia fimbriata]
MVREFSHGHAVVSSTVSINCAATRVASAVKKMSRIGRRTYKVRSSIKGGKTTRQISPWMTQFSLEDSRLIQEYLSSEECYMKCMKNIAVPYKFICEGIQEKFITDILQNEYLKQIHVSMFSIHRGQELPKKHDAKLKKGDGRARKGEGRSRTGEKDHIPRIRDEIVRDILWGKARIRQSVDDDSSKTFQTAITFTNNALRGRLGDAPTWYVAIVLMVVIISNPDLIMVIGRLEEDLGGKRIFKEQPVEDLGSSPDSSIQFSFPNWAFPSHSSLQSAYDSSSLGNPWRLNIFALDCILHLVFSSTRHLVISGGCIIIMESLYKMDFSLPVFLICSTILALEFSDEMLELVLLALKDLKKSLKNQGFDLLISFGSAENVIVKLVKEVKATHIFVEEEAEYNLRVVIDAVEKSLLGVLPTFDDLKRYVIENSQKVDECWTSHKAKSAQTMLMTTDIDRVNVAPEPFEGFSASNSNKSGQLSFTSKNQKKILKNSIFVSKDGYVVGGGTDVVLNALAAYLRYLEGTARDDWEEVHEKARNTDSRKGASFGALFGAAIQLGTISRRRVYYEAIKYEKERNVGFLSPFGYSAPTVAAAAEGVSAMEMWNSE